jgi:hypothetical protein
MRRNNDDISYNSLPFSMNVTIEINFWFFKVAARLNFSLHPQEKNCRQNLFCYILHRQSTTETIETILGSRVAASPWLGYESNHRAKHSAASLESPFVVS